MIGGVTTGSVPGRRLGLGSLTPSGRAVVPSGWALYDFANTIYSYAIVSYAIGLWSVDRLGRADGQFWVQSRPHSNGRTTRFVSRVASLRSQRSIH